MKQHAPRRRPIMEPTTTQTPTPNFSVKAILTPLLFIVLFATRAFAQNDIQCFALNHPATVDVDCAGTVGSIATWTVTATPLCGQSVTVTCVPPSGSTFQHGVTTVSCSAIDNLGNTESFTIAINVFRDTTPPVLQMPNPIAVACADTTGAIVNFAVTATDNCAWPVQVATVPVSGSKFPIGTNMVNCTAVDAYGNSVSGVFPVIVSSACAPCVTFVCPRVALTAAAGPNGVAGVDYHLTATNRCDGAEVKLVCLPPSGSDFPVGTNAVDCAAYAGGIEMRRCQFDVVVRDEHPPVIKVPGSIGVVCGGWSQTSGQAGRVVNFLALATDNVDSSPALVCDPPSGSFFPLGTNSVTCTATDNVGNSSAKSFAIIVKSGPACEVVANPDLLDLPDNWSFENGLTSWTRSGAAFDNQPTLGDNVTVKRIGPLKDQIEDRIGGDYWRDVGYPIGHQGRYWIGTAENHPDDLTPLGTVLGEGAKGWLQSKPFQIPARYISFLVGGHEDLDKLRVELLVETAANTPNAEHIGTRWYVVAAVDSGHDEETLRRDLWTVQSHVGKWARIRIIDDSTTGHINVDDFRFADEHPFWTQITIGNTNIVPVINRGAVYYDWDSPVWGFADLHTHPMSHLGLGGKIMHGKPGGYDAPIVQMALGDCNCSHGGWGVDNECGDYYRQLLMGVMDSHGNSAHREGYHENPWKQFRNWPVFSTIVHQQMWHDWIRRAYDGGLRVMVALCVNNELLAHASKGHLAHDDKNVGDSQILAMKQFATLHSDFCAIAYDPFQLREIIRENKLAIILGSELDNIGNMNHLPTVKADPATALEKFTSETMVKSEIQRLYNDGIRYIFPVHLIDNKLGGTAVGDLMLNVANKYANGTAFDLEAAPAASMISFEMDDLDFTEEATVAGVLGVVFGPALPALAGPIIDATVGPAAPGVGSIGSALLPVATIAAGNIVLLNALGLDPFPPDIWPLGGNFPNPPATENGHRNKRGLTTLGKFAVKEMMRLGMMLDIDHMSHHTLSNVFTMAEEVPGGYPLNSGHNSPLDLGKERNENHRTAKDYERLRELGGLAGVGFENSDVNSFGSHGPVQIWSTSDIDNDSAGTSKTFGQNYLYAFEKMRGKQIAFGTDINGFIAGPGPRFGPQGAFGIFETSHTLRDNQIRAQDTDGVLYSPKHGKALTTAAFVGPAVDPDRDTDEPARRDKGYEYNQDQRDFFAALRIFWWKKTASEDDLKVIEDALSDNYPNKRRIKEYAFGLVKGVTGASPGSDLLSPDTETREQLGKAVYLHKGEGVPAPPHIILDQKKWFRFLQHCKVWDDYQKIFGPNTPMKRCKTEAKEWDINFEGVAHYGLMPDFLQDLRNVGLNAEDMSPLFLSAEHFAQMWVKCLRGAAEIDKPRLKIYFRDNTSYWVEWYGSENDVLEYTNVLGDSDSWRTFPGEVFVEGNTRRIIAHTTSRIQASFFRVKRP